MHEQNVFHLDLKPDNILVTQAGEPYVIDLGSAQFGTKKEDKNVLSEKGMRYV